MSRLLVTACAALVGLAGASPALAEAGARGTTGPGAASLSSDWPISSSVVVAAAAGVVLFIHGFLRLRRRGRPDLASFWQLAVFLAAVGAGLLALVSPLDPIGETYLLSAHMLQHLVLFDVVPVLLLVSLRRPLLFFVVPPALLRGVGHGRLRRVVGALGRAEAALIASLVVCGLWMIPPIYEYAILDPPAHALEHVMLLVGGFLVWRQLLDPAADPHRSGRCSVIWCTAYCAAGFLAGGVLLLSRTGLYGIYAAQPVRLLGIDPRLDQQLAGLMLLGMQLVMLAVGLCLAGWREVGSQRRPQAVSAARANRTARALAHGSAVTTELS
jgi:putative membrane protein